MLSTIRGITTSKMSGLSGLDRKTMEQERLARVARKRLLEQSVGNEQVEHELGPKKRQRIIDISSKESPEDLSQIKTAKLTAATESRQYSNILPLHGSHLLDRKNDNKNIGLQYPDGVIKKTWARGFPRRADDITIEEVLQKDDLTLAILSTFQIDTNWILGKLSDKTRVYWVLQAKTDKEVSQH